MSTPRREISRFQRDFSARLPLRADPGHPPASRRGPGLFFAPPRLTLRAPKGIILLKGSAAPSRTDPHDRRALGAPKVSMVNIKKMDEAIRRYCDENKIFGVVRVTVGSKIAYEGRIGFADLATKREFNKNSMFTFYSLSKPFTAIGFLKLYDRGLVDLDAHPGKYLEEIKDVDPRITLRQMLCHTSGLPDFEENRAFFENEDARTTADSRLPTHYTRRILNDMKRLHELPLHFEPGTGGWYASVNIMTPALIIERLTGRDFAEYMKNEVFLPMGMTSVQIDEPGKVVPGRVTGYELDEKGAMIPVTPHYDWLKGAGDMIGTVDDVYCLNRAIKNRTILRPETWETVLTADSASGYGMGCSVMEWHGKRRITHNGGHKGFRTFHVQLPDDDFDVIIMSNSGYGNARNDLTEIVHDFFYGADGKIDVLPEWDKGFAT